MGRAASVSAGDVGLGSGDFLVGNPLAWAIFGVHGGNHRPVRYWALGEGAPGGDRCGLFGADWDGVRVMAGGLGQKGNRLATLGVPVALPRVGCACQGAAAFSALLWSGDPGAGRSRGRTPTLVGGPFGG